MVAVPAQEKIRPAFTVRKIEGTVPHKIHAFDKSTNRISLRQCKNLEVIW